MRNFFLFCSFAYTAGIILYASTQPLGAWINQQHLWGVYGLLPLFYAPLATPAFIFLILAVLYE